jgi:sugar lactone lactonase YvrE
MATSNVSHVRASSRYGRRWPWLAVVALTVAAPLTLAGATASAGTGATTAGIISTFAGGVGGPGLATTVAIGSAAGVAYASGDVYVAQGPVRAVSAQTDQLTTPAGDSLAAPGPLGDGGPATKAYVDSFGTPAVDQAGNLVIADSVNSRVRVVAKTSGTFYGRPMTGGHIYTVAGNGQPGTTSGGVPATKAELFEPDGVTVDSAGNLMIADGGGFHPHTGSLVQVVAAKTGTFYGQQMIAGDIYNIAGVSSTLGVSGNGGPAVKAGLGPHIGQVELDSTGDVVIADESANRIRVIAEKTGTLYGQTMTAGDIYGVAGNGGKGYSGDGGPATQAKLYQPRGVTLDSAGNLVVADTDNSRVRVVAVTSGTFYGQTMKAGDIYSIAGGGTGGDGGPAINAKLDFPEAVAIDGAGNVVLGDGSRVQVIAVATGTFYGKKMTAGDIYGIAGNGTPAFSGDGGPAANAELAAPGGVVFGSAGQLAVGDTGNDRLRLIPAQSGTYFGQQMTAGHVYTVAGDGQCPFKGGIGDGGPALKAKVCLPAGLAFDHAGNLVVANWAANRIRVVAASSGTFYGQKMTIGHIYSIAGNGTEGYSGDGGPATEASLNLAEDVVVDSMGNLIIPDTINNRVRVVATKSGTFYGVKMTANDIYTVAGNGTEGFSGDGGPALAAELGHPEWAQLDPAGNVLINDTFNERVRMVAVKSGTFYGV